MPRQKDTSHCVINYAVQPPRFECRHCGGTHPLKLPAPISVVSKQSHAFIKLHEDCKPGAAQ